MRRKQKEEQEEEEEESEEEEEPKKKKTKTKRLSKDEVQASTLDAMHFSSPPKRTIKRIVKKTFINEKGYRVSQDVVEEIQVQDEEPKQQQIPEKTVKEKTKQGKIEEEEEEKKQKKKGNDKGNASNRQTDIMSFFKK